MDVIFHCENGESFTIEVGFFDSFLEVKEKVSQYDSRIHVSKQLLYFEGKLLKDDDVVIKSNLCENSRIKLKLINIDVIFDFDGESFNIEVGFYDSFLEVKEKVFQDYYPQIPVSKQLLYFEGKLLKDEDVVINNNLYENPCIKLKLKCN